MIRKLFLGLALAGLAFFLWLIFKHAAAYPETRLLPYYALRTLLRLSVTYIVCLVFGLVIGIIAATRERVGNVVIPLLDILQSVPVLGFFPLALGVIIRAFHESTLGLEIASMFLLFTSMEWSIVFGVISGIKSIPASIADMTRVFHVRGWDYLRNILLPAIYPSLIAGSMLAWGGGWYFVIVTEFITFGEKVYTLPGLGYYLNKASFVYGDVWMSLAGLVVIAGIVFLLNRLIWHRLNERAKQYRFLALHGFVRMEGQTEKLWSHQVRFIISKLEIVPRLHLRLPFGFLRRLGRRLYLLIALILIAAALALFLGVKINHLSPSEIRDIGTDTALSLARLLTAYLISLILAISVGLLTLQRPSTKNAVLVLVDIFQSIPALAYFPLLFLIFTSLFPERIGLEISSILLVLTGMFWYLVLNVIEVVEHWPKEINELAGLFSIRGLRYLKHLIVPSLFPALITGSILAWGGGWNATIVSEYVNIGRKVHVIPGLGSALDLASNAGDTDKLLILLAVMVAIVLLLNHFVWRRLLKRASAYALLEEV